MQISAIRFVDLMKPLEPLDVVYARRDKTKWVRVHRWLPYGMWTCADGRQVFFNRSYRPIWQRRPGMAAEKADPGEWVNWRRQDYLFSDRNPPWQNSKTRSRVDRVLSDFLCGEPMHPNKWEAEEATS